MCSLFRSISSKLGGPLSSNYHRRHCVEVLPRVGTVLGYHSLSTESSSPNYVFDNVNSIITSKNYGQTFAVVYIYGRQFLVHIGDIISLQKAIPADVGERIKLEKCLLVGNENFTLVGRPVLNRDLVQVEATLIEKTMSQTYFNMQMIPRNRGYRRHHFQRNPISMLRINEITVCHTLNTSQERIN